MLADVQSVSLCVTGALAQIKSLGVLMSSGNITVQSHYCFYTEVTEFRTVQSKPQRQHSVGPFYCFFLGAQARLLLTHLNASSHVQKTDSVEFRELKAGLSFMGEIIQKGMLK